MVFADKRVDKVTEVEVPGQKVKRYTVSSRITLQPTAEDDYADYTCAARHEALPDDMPLRVTVQLSVLCKYPALILVLLLLILLLLLNIEVGGLEVSSLPKTVSLNNHIPSAHI